MRGSLPLAIQARLIRGARGVSGANVDYLVSTVRHLAELGIRERELERLVVMVGGLGWHRAGGQAVSPYAAALLRAERSRPAPVRRLARKEERRRFLYRLQLGLAAVRARQPGAVSRSGRHNVSRETIA